MSTSSSVTMQATTMSPYKRRKEQREQLHKLIDEVVAEIAMEDEAERNGTLHPDLVKERQRLRAIISKSCEPVDEFLRNKLLADEAKEDLNETMNDSFFAGVSLEEMDELQKLDF